MRFKPELVEKLKQEAELLPEGTHRVELIGAEYTTSKRGDEMVVLDFELADPWSAKRLRDYVVLRDGLLWKAVQVCAAFEVGFEDADFEDLIGKCVTVRVVHENDDGEVRAKIKSYRPDQRDGEQQAA
ncbi:DUF669 domain-containing protein [Actinomadura hibisca]|uniref:DUF669 domain-containing protein n=1 Tax=Actinomadura hibisca TaxID=68565 RepID=UPI00082A7FF2|nr:DUF669 domain-containing protein [Actinomadura hibisca]